MLKNILERFSCFTDLKSQIKRAKAQVLNYKEYDLEVEGSWLFGLKYYLNVYAGDKKFRFLLDSGCECSLIPYRYLKYFTHSFVCEGLSGSISGHISTERTYFAFFGLEPGYTEQDTITE